MLSRKLLITAISNCSISTSCCLQADHGRVSKQVHMLKKIIVGREKGKRRFVYNENLPKLESVKKLSDGKGQGKESNRRITVLNKLFMKNITDMMATDSFSKNIAGYGIQVSNVKVAPDFNSLNIFWLAQGDKNDLIVESTLKSIAGALRHELSQLRLMGEIPRIYFVRDRAYSKGAIVDILLAKADYGEDFVPTDPTLFHKTDPQLEMKLSDELKSKIYELEQSLQDEEIYEEELPEMRHDVLGLDHSMIMKKIATSIDKSKKAWETFGARPESFISNNTLPEEFVTAKVEIEKLNRDVEIRNNFVKFLERRQIPRRECKKNKNLQHHEDEDSAEDQRDTSPEEDFIVEDDAELKK